MKSYTKNNIGLPYLKTKLNEYPIGVFALLLITIMSLSFMFIFEFILSLF